MSEQPLERVAEYRIDLTRLLNMFYMDMEQQIARADAKANLILTANSILLVAAVNIIALRLRGLTVSVDLLWLLVPLVPALAFALLATNAALSVAYPRLVMRDKAGPLGLFELTSVTAVTVEAYQQRVMEASLDEVKREVLRGIHAKSAVLTRKFAKVRQGIGFTVAATLAWMLFMIVTVVQT
jgi:hypothetical protein